MTAKRRLPPRPPKIDYEELERLAKVHASPADVAAVLEMDEAALTEEIDDPAGKAGRIWRKGRAEARVEVRKAQFAHLHKNATIAVHLGRELLGQDGAGPNATVCYLVDTGIARPGKERRGAHDDD